MKIKVHVQCDHIGHEQRCQQAFDSTFKASDVRAVIERGGGVDLEWPEPDMPAGWRSYNDSFYCPDHVPSWLPKLPKR